MSESVIDRLVVRLGLDNQPLKKAAPQAGADLKKIEVQGDRTTASVKSLSGALTSFLAIVGGTAAIKHFIEDFIDANASLDRFSKNVGVNVSTLSAWGQAVEGFGGSAKSAYGTIDMLSKAQTELRLTGESGLIPYLSALGVSLATVEGQARPVDDVLLDLASSFSKMDRTTANNMGRMMGIDQDTMNLLLQGRHEVELTIKRQRENSAVTKEQAAEATKLQKSIVGLKQNFEAFGRGLVTAAAPALERVIAILTDFGNWIRTNQDFVKDFLEILAVGLGAIAVASLPLTGTVAIIGALAGAIALLWQDYQTWKRGGDSLIDWEKWEPGIKAAAAGLEWLAQKAAASFDVIKSGAKVVESALNRNWGGVTNATNEMSNDLRKVVGLKPLDHGAPATNAPQAVTASYAQKYFMDRGMSAAEAAGLAANIQSESSGKTNAVGDGGQAYGLLQWHKDRQANFAKFKGHDIRESTADEQLAFIVHELMQGTETAAQKRIGAASNAYDAGAAASRFYVRPGITEEAKAREANNRGSMARTLAGVNGASGMVAGASTGSPGGGTGVDNSKRVQIDNLTIHTQATDGAGVAEDFVDHLNYLVTANANGGLN